MVDHERDEPIRPQEALSASMAGAFGYVLKERVPAELLPLVRRALDAVAPPPEK